MRFMRYAHVASIAAFGTVLVACGNGSGGGGVPPAPVVSPSGTPSSPTPPPSGPTILVSGSARTFTGTDSTTYAYVSPSPGTANFTEASTFAATTTIQAAPAGAPAAFDEHTDLTYTVTQPAQRGAQPISATTDTYFNQTIGPVTTTIAEPFTKSVIVANDATANAAGGGPYTLTTTLAETYAASPFVNAVYPLQTGSKIVEPLARTSTVAQTDVNAGGGTAPTPYTVAESTTFNNDGSYARNVAYSTGEKRTENENANGSATAASPNSLFAESIGVPVPANAAYSIPVSVTSPSGVVTPYSATDWYPGGALPPAPLETKIETVKGPAASLPSGCAGALSQPNVVEVDLTNASLDVFGTYTNVNQQRFDANGVNVCLLRTTTTQYYSITTGALALTTTETYAQILKSVTSAADRMRRSKR